MLHSEKETMLEKKLNMVLPKVVFGTSNLGNLYEEIPFERKKEIVQEAVTHCPGIPVFDTAGKYGAGLALEALGRSLNEIGVPPDQVIISNKLGWLRKPLLTEDPTFEPGVWKGLEHDAYQRIGYDGIIQCFEEGNRLLGQYVPQMVSVHDPDEYLDAAENESDYRKRLSDIEEAYRALHDLKKQGKVSSVGIGAKNWKSIELLNERVELDWVMLANSLTIYQHPNDLLRFVEQLKNKGVAIINSAVFHGGFLLGGDFFNYKKMDPQNDQEKFQWREKFFALCERSGILPVQACIYFALHIPGIESIALSSSQPSRIRKNIEYGNVDIPASFWEEMKAEGLLEQEYPYL